MVRKTSLCLLTVLALLPITTLNSQAQSVLTRHTREVTRTGEARLVGRLPASQTLQLDIVLSVRDQAGLDAFVAAVNDPYSPSYRQFLTVPEFTQRFGPTQQDYDAVLAFAKASGLAVVGGTRDGLDVQVKGSVAAVQSAFHVNMLTFRHPTEGRTFYAPDREPTTSLPFSLWHVSGLDNYSIPHPMYLKKSDYAKAHGIPEEQVVTHATTGSGP